MPEPVICLLLFSFFLVPGAFWVFLILIPEQYFYSNLRIVFLAQRLWAFNFNVETMMVARCFWAFNYIHDYILICLCSCLYMIPACFIHLVASSALAPCT